MNELYRKKTPPKPVLVLDAGKVLVDFNLDRLLRELSVLCGKTVVLPLSPDLDAVCKELERGELTWEDFTRKVNTVFRISVDSEKLRRLWCSIFTGEIPGMRASLSSLKKDYQLVAMSNTCEVHWSFIVETYPIFNLFDGWVVSFEEGCMKPDSELYRIVMERFCGNKPPFYYTDDSKEFVESAVKLSWEADVFTDADRFQAKIAQLENR